MQENSHQILAVPPDISQNGYFIGTAGFDYDHWCGGFYRPGSSRADRLGEYQAYFSFLELSCYLNDSSNRETFNELAGLFRGHTECSVRVPKRISCPNVWQVAIGRELLKETIDAVYPLFDAGRLYSLIFAVDEKTIRSERALEYLVEVAGQVRNFRISAHIEFRHASWRTEHVLQTLKDNHLGICNIEVPVDSGFPLRYYATTEKGYVRYCGRNRKAWKESVLRGRKECFEYDYSASEIETMVDGQLVLGKKVSSSAVIFGNVSSITGVGNAVQNAQILDHRIRMAKVLARNKGGQLSHAKKLKIT